MLLHMLICRCRAAASQVLLREQVSFNSLNPTVQIVMSVSWRSAADWPLLDGMSLRRLGLGESLRWLLVVLVVAAILVAHDKDDDESKRPSKVLARECSSSTNRCYIVRDYADE